MTTSTITTSSDNDTFIFADEPLAEHGESPTAAPWKILIVDDDKEIHGVTEMVLRDITFEGAGLKMISAYSAEEGLEAMREHRDIAIILLDVVMEEDHSGLDLVKKIRTNLNNRTSRIILRTGQPGVAPERSVIVDYDINDYREKTELTSQKLFTTIIAALRNYRDMRHLDKSRQGLQRIVESSSIIFGNQSIDAFAENILVQLHSILNWDENMQAEHSSFLATNTPEGFRISSALGKFSSCITQPIPEESIVYVNDALAWKELIIHDNVLAWYFETKRGSQHILYVESTNALGDVDILRVFCNNVTIAIENLFLNMDIIDTQKDIILRMGEVVETRSKETANHVYRVAEYSYLIAKKIGLSEEQARTLRHASPMHDIGKVGVPDSILLKSGRLTPEEFAVMKTHTTLGYNIFRKSDREIIQASAIIAHEHHERWDGNGYPCGLHGEEIHIFARITTLADVFDALSNKRVYKEAWPEEEVYEYIIKNRWKLFDPHLVDVFLELREEVEEIKQKFPDDI